MFSGVKVNTGERERERCYPRFSSFGGRDGGGGACPVHPTLMYEYLL